MAEPALKFMDGSGFTSTGEAVAAPAIPIADLKIEPKKSVPATSLTDSITSGDISGLLKQNQSIFQEQLKAFDLSPEYLSLKRQFGDTQNQLRGLQTNYIQNQVGIENKPIPMDEIGNELTRLQKNVAFREIPLTNQLQAITGQLNVLQEERNQTLAKLQLMAEQGRYDTSLAMQFNEIRRAEQKEAKALAREYGITSPFYVEGGTVYRTSDGKAYSSESEFFNDPFVRQNGITSFNQAKQMGILSELGESLAMRLEREKMDRSIFESDRAFDFSQEQFAFDKDLALARLSLEEQQLLNENPLAQLNPVTGELEVQLNDDQLKKVDQTNEKKNLDSLANLERSAGRYQELVDQYGYEAFGTGRTLLEGAYADLKVKWKEAANLGALTGPDLDLIIEAVKPATGLSGIKQKLIGGGNQGLLSQLEKLRSNISEDGQRYYNQLIQRDANYQYSPYIQSLGKPFGITTPGQQTKADELFNSTFIGPTFNSAGNASGSNQVKGIKQKAQPMQPIAFQNALTQRYKAGSIGGQCGDYARKVASTLGLTYPRLGNGLTEKINAVRKYGTNLANARIGSILITKENPTYGHVAMIIGQNTKGWIVTESNFKQSNKISHGRTIPFNSSKLVGVINPTKTA